MKKQFQLIWGISFIVVILLITVGIILPPLISTTVFPAWLIVILCMVLLGTIACVVNFIIDRVRLE